MPIHIMLQLLKFAQTRLFISAPEINQVSKSFARQIELAENPNKYRDHSQVAHHDWPVHGGPSGSL